MDYNILIYTFMKEYIFKIIYKTTNLLNGKSYIGQHSTDNINDNYLGSGSELIKDIKKYGKDNFQKIIIEHCEDWKELNEKEKYWIIKHGTKTPNGYNILDGGDSFPILFGEKNGFYGKKHSEETKKILKEKRMGKEPWNKGKKGVQKVSKETRKKQSENMIGEKHWHYNKKGILSPNYGLKRSKETKKKLSNSKKGAKNPNVSIYELFSPDGKYFYVDYGAINFVKTHPEYHLGKYFISDALKAAKKGKLLKGWKILKIK